MAGSTSTTWTYELRRHAERPVKIGSFSAASNVTGIVTDVDAGRDHAAPPRRAVLLGLRGRRPVSADRHERRAAHPRRAARLQGRGVRLAAQVHRRSRDAGGARRQALAAAQPRPVRARRRDRPVRQPERALLPPRPGDPRGGRHARDRGVDPRRARVRAQGGGRQRGDPPPRARLRASRAALVGREPADRDPRQHGHPSGSRSSRSACATAGACCTRTSSSRCSATCSASRRAAAASAPDRTSTACTQIDDAGRADARRGGAKGHMGAKLAFTRLTFNYFISETVVPRTSSTPSTCSPATAGSCCRSTASIPTPASGTTAPASPTAAEPARLEPCRALRHRARERAGRSARSGAEIIARSRRARPAVRATIPSRDEFEPIRWFPPAGRGLATASDRSASDVRSGSARFPTARATASRYAIERDERRPRSRMPPSSTRTRCAPPPA